MWKSIWEFYVSDLQINVITQPHLILWIYFCSYFVYIDHLLLKGSYTVICNMSGQEKIIQRLKDKKHDLWNKLHCKNRTPTLITKMFPRFSPGNSLTGRCGKKQTHIIFLILYSFFFLRLDRHYQLVSTIGLDNLKGVFQPKWICDYKTLGLVHKSYNYIIIYTAKLEKWALCKVVGTFSITLIS